jgi:hypothetical protein
MLLDALPHAEAHDPAAALWLGAECAQLLSRRGRSGMSRSCRC